MKKIFKFLKGFALTVCVFVLSVLELTPLCLLFGSAIACIADFVLYLCNADIFYQSVTWMYWFASSAVVMVVMFISTAIKSHKAYKKSMSREATEARNLENAVSVAKAVAEEQKEEEKVE